MSAVDLIQRAREAIVAAIDTNADVAAETGRANGNIVDIDDIGESQDLPVLVYEFQSDELGPIVGSRRLRFQFTAAATSQGAANELIALVPGAIGYLAALDAIIESYERTEADEERLTGAFLAALNLTLIA